jgi:hypothetical protein
MVLSMGTGIPIPLRPWNVRASFVLLKLVDGGMIQLNF